MKELINPTIVSTLMARDYKGVGTYDIKEKTLTFRGGKNMKQYVVRRLTPLECERLQAFPQERMIDLSKMTKDEYIAYAILNGDIIVDAENGKVFRTRGPGGVKLSEPQELKGNECNGYLVSQITCNGTKLTCRLHRVIWISKYGVIPEGKVIDHINNNKKDNRISNLQLLTQKENSHKASLDGLYATGEDSKVSKLSEKQRNEIAFLYNVSDVTIRKLAEIYGISKSRVGQIVKEIGWTDIGEWVDSNGKTRQSSDTNRYKALGNSICCAAWVDILKGIAENCPHKSMASLFDGIGGFPLIWSRDCDGSILWGSEIEPFCIAVTKKHFGE